MNGQGAQDLSSRWIGGTEVLTTAEMRALESAAMASGAVTGPVSSILLGQQLGFDVRTLDASTSLINQRIGGMDITPQRRKPRKQLFTTHLGAHDARPEWRTMKSASAVDAIQVLISFSLNRTRLTTKWRRKDFE